jgi:ubiquinone/menaquinone biosynthesis C-methylase UbiE
MADLVGPDGLVIGVDPSHEMIEYARRKRRIPGKCEFEVGAAESLGFLSPDAHFDVVVSSLVMHHLPADLQARALTDMRRVLRPGGTLLIAEAQVPRAAGWRFISRLHGYDRMARLVPDLRALVTQAGFLPTSTGEAPPWLRYIVATRPPQ